MRKSEIQKAFDDIRSDADWSPMSRKEYNAVRIILFALANKLGVTSPLPKFLKLKDGNKQETQKD